MGLHANLVGGSEAEGAAREGRAVSGVEEEYKALARSYHDIVLYGKLWGPIRRATDREGGGCLLPVDQCTKTWQPVAEDLRENPPDMHVPHVEKPMCAAFKVYGEVPETVPLHLKRAWRQQRVEPPPGQARAWSTTTCARSAGGGCSEGRRPESQRGSRTRYPRGSGVPGTAWGGGRGWRPPHLSNTTRLCPCQRGCRPFHGGRRVPAGLHPCEGKPVVAGGLWILPSPQQ